MFVVPPLLVPVLAALVLALLGPAACSRPTTWDLHYDHSLAADAVRYEKQRCKSDADCGPFVCEYGTERCKVTVCRKHEDCSSGACIQNLCARAPLQAGRSCDAPDWENLGSRGEEPAETIVSEANLDGCACVPSRSLDRGYSSGDPCGPFPCTPGGCYVEECRGDEDCQAGVCSSHASWPHGYCVVSDPH